MGLGMGMGMMMVQQVAPRQENQTKANATNSANTELKNKNELAVIARLVAQIQASTFVWANCVTQVQMMQSLIACGRLVVENDCSDEEYSEIADEAEKEYDTDGVLPETAAPSLV